MKLYSVSRSVHPYDSDELVGHELEYREARRLSDSFKSGIISLFPSTDLY